MRRQLGAAERDLERTTQARDIVADDLAAAGGDHALLARLSESLARAQAAVDAAEHRWFVLAAEAETLGLVV